MKAEQIEARTHYIIGLQQCNNLDWKFGSDRVWLFQTSSGLKVKKCSLHPVSIHSGLKLNGVSLLFIILIITEVAVEHEFLKVVLNVSLISFQLKVPIYSVDRNNSTSIASIQSATLPSKILVLIRICICCLRTCYKFRLLCVCVRAMLNFLALPRMFTCRYIVECSFGVE
ncbi:hypothetical protein AB3S75_023449 [Citrus x aurantiifolia]